MRYLAVMMVLGLSEPAWADELLSMEHLVRMSREQLECLYRQARVPEIPHGKVDGRAIFDPGSKSTVRRSLTTRIIWQGKVFRDDGVMINRVLGLRAVKASITYGTSYLDDGPALILDYAGMSKLFGDVRDEVREVSPGLYLGLTHRRTCCGPELLLFFTLDGRRCR